MSAAVPAIFGQEGLTPSLLDDAIPPEEPLERRCSGVWVNDVIVHALGCEWPQGPGDHATHGASPACMDLTFRTWRLKRKPL